MISADGRTATISAEDLAEAARQLGSLLGLEAPTDRGSVRPSDEFVDELLGRARDALGAPDCDDAGRIGLAALALTEARQAFARDGITRRIAAIRGVQTALSTLHEAADVGRLYDATTKALCEHCGFDRAILFGVDGDELVTHSVHFVGHDDWAREILELGRGPGRPQLADMLRETDMVRRRRATVVTDAQGDPNTPRVLDRGDAHPGVRRGTDPAPRACDRLPARRSPLPRPLRR